ncbi:MAG: hypothetical protein JW395_1166 [Nitrospira sp.]|nr:hypothetical protein [Nitrospira sp.]
MPPRWQWPFIVQQVSEMKFPGRNIMTAWMVGCLLLVGSPGTLAGGSGNDDEHEDVLRYFGFVRDNSGRAVAAARVSLDLKGSVSFSAATDTTGAYRIPVPRILPNVSPENVRISCSKDGYKQLRTVVKSSLNIKPLLAVEVECIMQTATGK